MAVSTAPKATAEGPPDVRGPTAPIPATIFAVGLVALLVMGLGTVVIQVDYAVVGPPLSHDCISVGIDRLGPDAAGVCHIVEGLRSAEERIVLAVAILLGLVAIAAGFSDYRRVDTRRKRDHPFDGATPGVH